VFWYYSQASLEEFLLSQTKKITAEWDCAFLKSDIVFFAYEG